MIAPPQSHKHFRSAQKRFLQSSIETFFDKELPRTFGPVIRQKLAERIVDLVNQQLPQKDHLRPGQCVWNAVSISTRPDSPNCRLIPVILTLVDSSDVEQLARGVSMSVIAKPSRRNRCSMKAKLPVIFLTRSGTRSFFVMVCTPFGETIARRERQGYRVLFCRIPAVDLSDWNKAHFLCRRVHLCKIC